MTHTDTITAEDLYLLGNALRTQIAKSRREQEAGTALALRLPQYEELRRKIDRLYEQATGDGPETAQEARTAV